MHEYQVYAPEHDIATEYILAATAVAARKAFAKNHGLSVADVCAFLTRANHDATGPRVVERHRQKTKFQIPRRSL